MKGAGFSLWIVPEGEVRRRLAALIRALSRRFGGPVFEPHVTLRAGLPGPAPEVLAKARKAVRSRGPFAVRFGGPEAGDTYFRCLYLRVEPSPDLLALHESVREVFGRPDEPPFFPHLSLLYAPPPAPPIVDEIRASLPAGFGARRVDVCSTEGEVERWHRVGRLKLG
jgi:2'-5' RNA ligase